MSRINIFCFGFGQVAEGFINKLIQEKAPHQMLYLNDNERFGNVLRKYMNECGLYEKFT